MQTLYGTGRHAIAEDSPEFFLRHPLRIFYLNRNARIQPILFRSLEKLFDSPGIAHARFRSVEKQIHRSRCVAINEEI